MPNWAGSSWYFLRYIDPKNDKVFADKKLMAKWLPVDWYNGGMEHTTLHLLYSRFWHRFLYDCGFVPTPEPYAKRTSHGVVLGPDGRRMSKSKGNVINPDDVLEAYGADTFRMYMMFIGPFEQNVTWSNESIQGVRRFLNRAWTLSTEVVASGRKTSGRKVLSAAHRLVKKIEEDLEALKFNTAISVYMETLNAFFADRDAVGTDAIELFAACLFPCAPHLAEEIGEVLGNRKRLYESKWPVYDENMLKDALATIVVQVNGKVRGTVEVCTERAGDEIFVKNEAVSALNMREKYNISDDTRTIFLPGKLINFIG